MVLVLQVDDNNSENIKIDQSVFESFKINTDWIEVDEVKKTITIQNLFFSDETKIDDCIAYSGPNLPLIPEHACHLFRRKTATHSG